MISLHEDSDGALWIGTSDGGLNRLKQGKFVVYATRNGLPDDVIYGILADRQNNLWLSSNKGIFRLNRKELDDFAGERGNLRRSHGPADGDYRECSGHPASWCSADGKLGSRPSRGHDRS